MYVPQKRSEHVLVYARKRHGDGCKWTSGRYTGQSDDFDEHFQVVTDSPLVEDDKAFYHYEDIKEPTDENVARHIGEA